MTDKFDKSREYFGAEKIDDFLSKFGIGPNYIPKEKKKYNCKKCKMGNAYYKEIHADTDMNDIVLYCPDCKFTDE